MSSPSRSYTEVPVEGLCVYLCSWMVLHNPATRDKLKRLTSWISHTDITINPPRSMSFLNLRKKTIAATWHQSILYKLTYRSRMDTHSEKQVHFFGWLADYCLFQRFVFNSWWKLNHLSAQKRKPTQKPPACYWQPPVTPSTRCEPKFQKGLLVLFNVTLDSNQHVPAT